MTDLEVEVYDKVAKIIDNLSEVEFLELDFNNSYDIKVLEKKAKVTITKEVAEKLELFYLG